MELINILISLFKVIDGYSFSAGSNNGTNQLGLLVFCLLFGNVIGNMGDRGRDLHNFFETLSKAFFGIIKSVILYAFVIKIFFLVTN